MSPSTRIARAAEHREIIESRAHRARVRVVAVVDERRAAAPRVRLQPAAHGRRAAQAGHDVVAARADGLTAAAAAASAFAMFCRPSSGSRTSSSSPSGRRMRKSAPAAYRVGLADRRAVARSEKPNVTVSSHGARAIQSPRKRIVRVQHGGARLRQVIEQLALGGRDALERAEALEVRGTRRS